MRLTIALMLLGLSAPALAAPRAGGSPLHDYVLGRYAASVDAIDLSARLFDAAQAADPGQPAPLRRAFDLAIAAGDLPRATALAAALQAAGQAGPETALIRITDAVKRGDWRAVDTARDGLKQAGFAVVVAPIVEAWTLYGKGQGDAALAKLDPALYSGFARGYTVEQRAHLLVALKRWREAAALYGQIRAGAPAGINFLRQGEADALQQAGDIAAATALLAGDDPLLAAARARLAAGKRIGALAPDPARGIGWMATRLATDLARERPVPLAVLFARMGSFLAPDNSAAWLVTGDVLARAGQAAAALGAWDRVSAGDPLAGPLAARRAELLSATGQEAAAGRLLEAAVARPGATADDWTRLGDWHRRGDRSREAASAYGRALALAGAKAGWPLYFLRGSSLEQAGDWAAAEPDLRAALAKAPQEPVVLNYLGYSLLDRGQKPDEAAALIERAAALRPDDGGIIDSLGWSLYRRGRYAEAVAQLEKAATLAPADATITAHLGDALWQVGRRIEARFRWRAAYDLDPAAADRPALKAKLDYGLDAAAVMAAVGSAPAKP